MIFIWVLLLTFGLFVLILFLPTIIEHFRPEDVGRKIPEATIKRFEETPTSAPIEEEVEEGPAKMFVPSMPESGGSKVLKIKGDFVIEPDSEIFEDVVAEGELKIGDRSRCHGDMKGLKGITVGNRVLIAGNVISGGPTRVGNNSAIQGILDSVGDIYLGKNAFVGLSLVTSGTVSYGKTASQIEGERTNLKVVGLLEDISKGIATLENQVRGRKDVLEPEEEIATGPAPVKTMSEAELEKSFLSILPHVVGDETPIEEELELHFKEEVAAKLPSEKRKIMVVDDEKNLVFVMEKMLKRYGFETTHAYDGKEALKKVKKERPDLILCDIMMPEMSGWDVCKTIKEDPETKDIPVAMVSVRGSAEDRFKSFHTSHADAHIAKPLNLEKFLTMVKGMAEPQADTGEE